MIQQRMSLLVVSLVALAMAIPGSAFGQKAVSCGCRCGIVLSAPCGPEDCMRACGYNRPTQPDNGPPSDTAEQERARQRTLEDERQRAEEQRRRDTEEAARLQRQRETDEAARKQQDFIRELDAASKLLKGANTIHDHSSRTFGLKGVGDTGIKDVRPDRDLRDVSTAWKQLHCSRELASYALKAARKTGGQVDLAEVRYLANEALNALNGVQLGVKCSDKVPPLPRVGADRSIVDGRKPEYEAMLRDVVLQAERIDSANRELPGLATRATDAKERVERLRQGASAPPVSGMAGSSRDTERIKEATIEQREHQKKDQQRINEVLKLQKERESAMAEALAALREAQALINRHSTEKAQALQRLKKYEEVYNKAPGE